MRKISALLTTLVSGLLASIGKADVPQISPESHNNIDPSLDHVTLRPLNRPEDNKFAAHRSHSSHSSHRSSSGGGYSSPAPATPQRRESAPAVPGRSMSPSEGAQPTDPGRAAPVTPTPTSPRAPALSNSEKLKLQIMRVQIALTSLGLYKETISGELDDETKESLKHFQTLKGIKVDGLMSTDTLNALGVPAVQ
jgi:His-Xaa-Ser repeat protein HxsA